MTIADTFRPIRNFLSEGSVYPVRKEEFDGRTVNSFFRDKAGRIGALYLVNDVQEDIAAIINIIDEPKPWGIDTTIKYNITGVRRFVE